MSNMATVAPKTRNGLLDPKQWIKSVPDAFGKLNPRTLWRNPVMFIVEIGAVGTTLLAVVEPNRFAWVITGWLWLTVLFANAAEAIAEGRGKAQADSLRRAKTDTLAYRLVDQNPDITSPDAATAEVAAPTLARGDLVLVKAG
ncbi:MAG: potassium-transporting ATPase subunit B, partial [Stackebrandtia sp.]